MRESGDMREGSGDMRKGSGDMREGTGDNKSFAKVITVKAGNSATDILIVLCIRLAKIRQRREIST